MFQITTATHPSSDLARPSIVLNCLASGRKYLIGNVPEGAQRIINENKLGLNKIDEIYLTGKVDWASIGGLPGFILTTADQGRIALKLNYCGTDKFLKYIISSWRYFIFRFGMNLSINELENGDVMKNSGFDVIPVSISADNTETSNEELDTYHKLANIVNRVFPLKTIVGNNFISNIKLPDIQVKSSQSCNYIFDFHPLRGKFMIEKLKLLNIPRGPSYAKLSNGESITLPDGTIITPDQVLAPLRTMGKVLVLDIPSEEYLSKTLSYDWGSNVQCIYHFLGDEFPIAKLQSPEYIEFFNKFANAQHLISHSKLCSDSINFHSSALLTLKLKSINNELFRLPQSNEIQNVDKVPFLGRNNVSVLNSLQNVLVKPDTPIQVTDDACNTLDTSYWDKLYDDQIEPLDLKFHEKSAILSREYQFEQAGDVEVITLGTGSALPSKYRNVISTVLRIPNKDAQSFNSIILDAGENTIGSMKRLFTQEEFVQFFQSELSVIYLSHLHADHHLGIISLIETFNDFNTTNRKLHVICPWQYDLFLKEWFKFNGNLDGLKNVIYSNCEFFETSQRKLSPLKQYDFALLDNLQKLPRQFEQMDIVSALSTSTLFQDAKIKEIQTCKAIHCDWAYSISIVFENGFKISYSGDTRPSLEFAKIGRGSNLLIHEATLEDELILDLIDKRHTTILELKHLLLLMKADNLVLTHFSQRYPRLPNSKDENRAEIIADCLKIDKFSIFTQKLEQHLPNDKIIYAFDNMWFKLGDINLQYEKFNGMDLSFLEKLFVEEEVQNDRKRSNDQL